MKNKNIQYGLLILAVILFVVQPFIFNSHGQNHAQEPLNILNFKDGLANSFIILTLYINYKYILSKYFLTQKYFHYLVFIICSCLAIVIVPNLLTGFPTPKNKFAEIGEHNQDLHHKRHLNRGKKHNQFFFKHDIEHHIPFFLALLFLSIIIKMRSKFYEAEILQKKSEMAILNAQVSPHFLFNALNTIYILSVKENATITSDATLKLSSLLRYADTELNKGISTLQNELKYLTDFIAFQKLRFGHAVQVNYHQQELIPDKEIGTLLFIPFVENAFKHGINPDKESEININIQYKNNVLYFKCTNTKSVSIKTQKSGIGLENTKNRLANLYPQRHTLTINDSDTIFMVLLNIQLL
jgi:hypothetical protein